MKKCVTSKGTKLKKKKYGKKTLFIEGIQDTKEIVAFFAKEQCEHLFLGANPVFKSLIPDEWTAWENMIIEFLKEGYLCSLDIPIKLAEEFLEGPLVEYNNFIPQLPVPQNLRETVELQHYVED